MRRSIKNVKEGKCKLIKGGGESNNFQDYERWSRLFGQFGSKVKVELGYFLRCLTGSPFQGG